MKEKNFEFKGSTKEDAIAAGLKDLGLTAEEVSVEVLSYGGFFSKASVRLTVLDKPAPEEAEKTEEAAVLPAEKEPATAEAGEKTEKTFRQPTAEELAEAETAIVAFAAELIAKMGLSSTVTSSTENGEVNVYIGGDSANVVIGYRGEVLDAIQYYALVIANKGEKNYIRVQVNAGNYREKRKEILENLATRLAHKAAKTGFRVDLEPMNPFERRIIHTALANDRFVRTESEGEGKYRHVVIIPKEGRPGSRGGGDFRGNRDNNRRNDNRNDNRGRGGNRSDSRYNNDRRDNSRGRYEEKPYREEPQARPPQETAETVEKEMTYGESSFSKKGPSRMRSFGYNEKKF